MIQPDIGLVCDISTLSDNQKVELLLNHFTPGDGYDFAHEAVQKGANKWKLSFQLAWLTELEWLVYSPVKGGGYCKYGFLLGHLTREYKAEDLPLYLNTWQVCTLSSAASIISHKRAA